MSKDLSGVTEAVARAMTAKRVEIYNKRFGMDIMPGWDEYTEEGKQDAIEEAAAAIVAMQAAAPMGSCAEDLFRALRPQAAASDQVEL